MPVIPQLSSDPNTSLQSIQQYLGRHAQDITNKFGAITGGDYLIQKEIENLVVKWALIDPLTLSDDFQICDGSTWKAGYAKTYWDAKGLTNIPNLCGYALRAMDMSKGVDPDCADRRQRATGTVATGGTVIALPKYYINIIDEAIQAGRTVKIGINASDMFGTLSPVGTVTAVDIIAKTVTVGTALTVGEQSLIIQGDVIGSFQSDAIRNITGTLHGNMAAGAGASGAFTLIGNSGMSDGYYGRNSNKYLFDASRVVPTGLDNRPKNISYLPIMWVKLPSQPQGGGTISSADVTVDALMARLSEIVNLHQVVQNHVISPITYPYAAVRASAVEVACLTTQITTKHVDSQIAFDALIGGEVYHDAALILTRTVGGVETEIGNTSPAGNRLYGITTAGIYDGNDNATTPFMMPIQYVDSPGVVAGTLVTYKIKVYGTASTIAINRTISDTDNTSNERITSNVRLTEFGGTPTITASVISDIATEAVAKAGADDTKIITPKKLRDGLNASGSAPVYACRAWVCFNGTGTAPTILGAGNVQSITDHSAGLYGINLTEAMPDTNYAIVGTCMDGDSTDNSQQVVAVSYNQTITTSYFKITTTFYSSILDSPRVCVSIFR